MTNHNKGYYVMGKHTSVAWCLNYDEAIKVMTFLNYRGGQVYYILECE